MQIYKFKTRISKTGKIKLPISDRLFNKDVEIIIVPQTNFENPKQDILNFLGEWTGFLNDQNTDESKYSYLTEKHL